MKGREDKELSLVEMLQLGMREEVMARLNNTVMVVALKNAVIMRMMFYAARRGYVDVLSELAKSKKKMLNAKVVLSVHDKEDLRTEKKRWTTLLHEAVEMNQYEVVEFLLNQGVKERENSEGLLPSDLIKTDRALASATLPRLGALFSVEVKPPIIPAKPARKPPALPPKPAPQFKLTPLLEGGSSDESEEGNYSPGERKLIESMRALNRQACSIFKQAKDMVEEEDKQMAKLTKKRH